MSSRVGPGRGVWAEPGDPASECAARGAMIHAGAMDILMVAAELDEGAGHTPAGSSVAGLAKALKHLGHNVTVVCPKLPDLEGSGILLARRLTPLVLQDGTEVTLLDAQLPSGVLLTTFDAPLLFDRPGVYGEGGKDYPDNAKRFGLLAQVALGLCRQRMAQGHVLDVVHAHDAGAGLVPLLLSDAKDVGVPCVFTVHDFERQVALPQKDAEDLGLPKHLLADERLRLGSKLNLLATGLASASAVTTVSPSYAEQLLDDAVAGPLAALASSLPAPPLGILGGVDYAVFNPATDAALPSRYDAEDTANKGRCKTALLREAELELDFERPLFAFLGPLEKEAGFDQLSSGLAKLLKQELSLVVVGQPNGVATKRLETQLEKQRDKLAWLRRSDVTTLRRVLSAADFVLGLDRRLAFPAPLLVAQRYGAIPVARAVGGVADAVVDADLELETGSGILMDGDDVDALQRGVGRALAAFRSPGFGGLRRRVMRRDASWDRPARRTLQVYRQAMVLAG